MDTGLHISKWWFLSDFISMARADIRWDIKMRDILPWVLLSSVECKYIYLHCLPVWIGWLWKVPDLRTGNQSQVVQVPAYTTPLIEIPQALLFIIYVNPVAKYCGGVIECEIKTFFETVCSALQITSEVKPCGFGCGPLKSAGQREKTRSE
jgi:hypothetical protein